MTRTVCKNFDFIKKLCKPRGRKQLLKNLSKDNVKVLCEICLNIIRGNITVVSKQKFKLKKYRSLLETLANKKVSLAKKKTVISNQKGGFIGTLASIALPVVSGIVAKALSTKKKKKKNSRKRK